MTEEYHSIMKNDVWNLVPRLERKSVVNSRWLYKIKHVADGSVEKYKFRLVSCGFSRKRELIIRIILLQCPGIPPLDLLFHLHYYWAGSFTRWM